MHPRTRMVGWVFATIVLFPVGLPAFGQDKTQPAAVPSPDISKALDQLREIDSTISTLRPTVSQEINARLDRIPPVPKSETPGLTNIALEQQPVSKTDRTKLLNTITEFSRHTQSKNNLFTFWAIIFIAASAVFALAGGILSFLKKNIWAGVLGLLVTAVIAFSNAYPFNGLSAFYGWLNAQTEALRIECQLKEPFTSNAYEAESKQLTLLVLSEGKRPGFGNYKAPIQDIANDVEKVKVAAATIERENAFTQGTVVVKAHAKPETQRILVKNRDYSPRTTMQRQPHVLAEKEPPKDNLRLQRPDFKIASKPKKPPQN